MKRAYEVLVHGTGYILNWRSGIAQRGGFYVTGRAMAFTPEEAILEVLALVRGAPQLEGQDSARLEVETIEEVKSGLSSAREESLSGFTFYPADDIEPDCT